MLGCVYLSRAVLALALGFSSVGAPAQDANDRRIISALQARMDAVRRTSAFEASVIEPLESAHLQVVSFIRRKHYGPASRAALRIADIMVDLIARRQRLANSALPEGAPVGTLLVSLAGERNEISCMYLMNERLRPLFSVERAWRDRPFGSCTNTSLRDLRSRVGRRAIVTQRDFMNAFRIP